MIDHDSTGVVRLVGLLGLALSMCIWGWAERSGRRQTLVAVSAGAALFSALIYFVGVMATTDSGASRFLPRVP